MEYANKWNKNMFVYSMIFFENYNVLSLVFNCVYNCIKNLQWLVYNCMKQTVLALPKMMAAWKHWDAISTKIVPWVCLETFLPVLVELEMPHQGLKFYFSNSSC